MTVWLTIFGVSSLIVKVESIYEQNAMKAFCEHSPLAQVTYVDNVSIKTNSNLARKVIEATCAQKGQD